MNSYFPKTKYLQMKKILLIFISALFIIQLSAQDKVLTLDDVIEIALEQSPSAQIAKHRFRSSYWEYRFYKAEQLPSLSVNGELPSIQNNISTEKQNGITVYNKQNLVRFGGGLMLEQAVPWTGGNIFMSSDIYQSINYLDSTQLNTFVAVPINIGFNQPLFQFNRFKWDRKIAPIKYELAKKQYLEAVEQVNLNAINYFFNLVIAQVQHKIAEINVSNYDTLYKVARGRYSLGRIGENEVLQMELSWLKAQSALEQNTMNLNDAMFVLKSFLRLKAEGRLSLIIPAPKYFSKIDKEIALEKALNNSSAILDFEKRLLEAERELSKSKHYGFDANLRMLYGLNGYSNSFDDVYTDPSNQQVLMMSLNIPILDWGKRKGQVKMAESIYELEMTSIDQEKIDFNQSIYLKVGEFNIQKNQLIIAAKSDTIAQKSFNVSKNRYLIGKIGVTDLNIAQTEADGAKAGYISALRSYWRNYIDIRKLTLYDFQEGKDLNVNYEDIYED